MTNKHLKKENDAVYEIKKINDAKVDEIIFEAEREGEVNRAAHLNSDGESSLVKFGQSVSSVAIVILLVLSLIQSYELINLKKAIQKGQFNGSSNSAPAAPQGLPAQQGGC